MPKITLTDGSPVTPEHREIDPKTGMQKDYVVLSEEERAKGFVRLVRNSYRHVGIPGPTYLLRDLTNEERKLYGDNYAKFETYPEGSSRVGRFWTQKELDNIGKGCGVVTRMNAALSETYARDPFFYDSTYCVHCKTHFPVGECGEFVWVDDNERVGT